GLSLLSCLSCASAGKPNASSNAKNASLADLDILNLPAALEGPGLDAIVVVDRVDATNFTQGVLARLHVAGVVRRARLQQQLFAIPVELEIETHTGLVEHRAIDARGAPIPSAIERNIDALDLAASRPGKARDHIETLLRHRRLRRWRGDH